MISYQQIAEVAFLSQLDRGRLCKADPGSQVVKEGRELDLVEY